MMFFMHVKEIRINKKASIKVERARLIGLLCLATIKPLISRQLRYYATQLRWYIRSAAFCRMLGKANMASHARSWDTYYATDWRAATHGAVL